MSKPNQLELIYWSLQSTGNTIDTLAQFLLECNIIVSNFARWFEFPSLLVTRHTLLIFFMIFVLYVYKYNLLCQVELTDIFPEHVVIEHFEGCDTIYEINSLTDSCFGNYWFISICIILVSSFGLGISMYTLTLKYYRLLPVFDNSTVLSVMLFLIIQAATSTRLTVIFFYYLLLVFLLLWILLNANVIAAITRYPNRVVANVFVSGFLMAWLLYHVKMEYGVDTIFTIYPDTFSKADQGTYFWVSLYIFSCLGGIWPFSFWWVKLYNNVAPELSILISVGYKPILFLIFFIFDVIFLDNTYSKLFALSLVTGVAFESARMWNAVTPGSLTSLRVVLIHILSKEWHLFLIAFYLGYVDCVSLSCLCIIKYPLSALYTFYFIKVLRDSTLTTNLYTLRRYFFTFFDFRFFSIGSLLLLLGFFSILKLTFIKLFLWCLLKTFRWGVIFLFTGFEVLQLFAFLFIFAVLTTPKVEKITQNHFFKFTKKYIWIFFLAVLLELIIFFFLL